MHPIVFGLVRVVVIKALGDEASVKMESLPPASVFLVKKIEAMPLWLKFPMLVLTFLFNIWGFVSTGHLFQAQSLSQQMKTVGAWQDSSIKLCREFIKFYEKLALFIYFSL